MVIDVKYIYPEDYAPAADVEAINRAFYGATFKKNDIYQIVINANRSFSEQVKTLKHELLHIKLGHLDDNSRSAAECEKEVEAILANG